MNEAQYNLISPLQFYWQNLEQTGNLTNINEMELHIMKSVHDEILGVKTNISCKNCVLEMVQFLGARFKKYEQTRTA